MFIVCVSCLITVLYAVLIICFSIGWKRINPFIAKEHTPDYTFKVAVIVAFRDEEKNLPKLINALTKQTFDDFELILINDHSGDSSVSIVEDCIFDFKNAKLLHANGFGKKNALKEAILHTKSEFILTTDADCIPENTWIETLYDFQSEFPSDLLVCPVGIKSNATIFSKLEQLEFGSLVASGAGAVGVGKPILCNAANMAFTRKAWLDSRNDLHEELISGDDVFLLLSIKKRGGIIRFVKSKAAFVHTKPAYTVSDFVIQRQRWTSKSSAYVDLDIIVTAVLVFGISLVQVCLLFLSFFSSLFLLTLGLVTFIKILVDLFFFNETKKFFHPALFTIHVLLLSCVYPFYIVYVAFIGLFLRIKKW